MNDFLTGLIGPFGDPIRSNDIRDGGRNEDEHGNDREIDDDINGLMSVLTQESQLRLVDRKTDTNWPASKILRTGVKTLIYSLVALVVVFVFENLFFSAFYREATDRISHEQKAFSQRKKESLDRFFASDSAAQTTPVESVSSFDDLSSVILIGQILAAIHFASYIGIIIGICMTIYGFAQLFLEKEALFSQFIKEQTVFASNGHMQFDQSRKDSSVNHHTNIGGDANNATIGAGASSHARDVNISPVNFDCSNNQSMNYQEVFAEALGQVDHSDVPQQDKDDVRDDLKKLAMELSASKPNTGRVIRLLENIEKIIPRVATTISSIASVAKLIHPV